MPRIARDVLSASFFHVIVQGINKEFNKNLKNTNIQVIAYCIMDNHAHFLLKSEKIQEISKLMQKTNGRYAKYYNFINERVGYVFRDRFLSEPILNQRYFIQCIKYIHLNPVKANMVKKCEDYRYSSFEYYLKNKNEILNKGNISNEEYKDICNSNYCIRNFLDVDRDIREDIENGIAEFMHKEKKSIIDLLYERSVFKDLVYFLKINEKINYRDICQYFEISKKLIKNL